MSQRGLDFAKGWLGSNVHSNPFMENDDFNMEKEVADLEQRLLQDAEAAGYDDDEFDDVDLSDIIQQAMEDVYDPEIGGFKD